MTTQMDSRLVEVIDCTLRDGEQSPGVWLTTEQKVELALLLSKAGVDVLDAGFPAAGSEEIEAMRAMKRRGVTARLGATARAVPGDVDAALAANADMVFVFAPISESQRATLGLDRERLAQALEGTARYAISRGLGVSLVLGDATGADVDEVVELAARMNELAIERLVLCDSMGVAVPSQIAALVGRVVEALPERRVCVHCHNDFAMATANTIAALAAGARSFTATVNGIGERAGNADLAEVLAGTSHLLGRPHGVDPLQLLHLSRTVESFTGIHMSPLKPVTGMNVYRHESGIHVDAILKDASSYQALPPAWVGAKMELVLGKHSGTAQVRALLRLEGLPSDEETVTSFMKLLKSSRDLCDRRDASEMLAQVESFRRRILGGIPAAELTRRLMIHPPPFTAAHRGGAARPGPSRHDVHERENT